MPHEKDFDEYLASLFVSHTHDSDPSSNKGVALVEGTSSQVVRPALEGVAVLLEEEGNSNSQEARQALEEGELIMICFCVLYGVMCRDDVQL